MLKGKLVILRPMQKEDIARHHEFAQNLDLYGLDCGYPVVSSLESWILHADASPEQVG